jgi:hypothetical protein
MYPSILGDVTPSNVRFDGRVYVKEGTHTLSNTGLDVVVDWDGEAEVGLSDNGLEDVGFVVDDGVNDDDDDGFLLLGLDVGGAPHVGFDEVGFREEGLDVGNDVVGEEEEGFNVVDWDVGEDVGVEVGWDDGFEVRTNVGTDVGSDVGVVVVGFDDVGFPEEGLDEGAVKGIDVLGAEVGEDEGFDVVGWEDVGSDVAALIFVTSFVGFNVVGMPVGDWLTQPFTTRQIFPLPDSFPVEMVSDGSVLHLRLNLICILVLLVMAACVDISQHDS